jgi:hypothetical protein
MKDKIFQNFKRYILHILENEYKTVQKRKDKKIKNYMNFVYIGLLKYFFNYNDKHDSIIRINI